MRVQVRDPLCFPVDELLDMRPYMSPCAHSPERGCTRKCAAACDAQGGLYRLHCVIEHIGRTMHGGHYIAYVRTAGRWLQCDDLRISEVSAARVQEAQAYLLIFNQDAHAKSVK